MNSRTIWVTKLRTYFKTIVPGMVAQAFDSSTQEAEAVDLCRPGQLQLGLCSGELRC